MSYIKKALQTKESKEAIGDFVVTWFSTGSSDKSINAMINTAKRNGAYKQVQVGTATDIVDAIFDYLK